MSCQGETVASVVSFGEPPSNIGAQGIESGDLTLDLILRDIAEYALQVTGATGAAIALEWEGALVCRAAAGATAPDIGVKVNVESGLSGTCVRERTMQWCSDTECDARVDAEASRSLGIRSIIVMPLFVADRMVGVFEILSARVDAFRDRDVKAMQDAAWRVTDAVRGERPTAKAPAGPKTAAGPSVWLMERASGETAGAQHSAQLLKALLATWPSVLAFGAAVAVGYFFAARK